MLVKDLKVGQMARLCVTLHGFRGCWEPYGGKVLKVEKHADEWAVTIQLAGGPYTFHEGDIEHVNEPRLQKFFRCEHWEKA
jgi:hypothetical protein